MNKDIKVKIETTPITPQVRTMEFGKFKVDYNTGHLVYPKEDDPKILVRFDNTICEKTTTLKEYYERVYKQPFIEKEWSFVTEDMYNLHGISPASEIELPKGTDKNV